MADSISSVSSSLTGITSSNPLRMFGLASGIDIDSIVEKLMTAERIPLTQMQQQKQLLQWQQDDYRSMNSLLLDLYNMTFDMTLQSSYLAKQATSSDESLVSVTSSSNAVNTSYVLENGTLATAARNASTASIAQAGFDATKSLWEMRDQFVTAPFSYSVTSTNETITAAADGTTFQLSHRFIDDTKGITITVDGTVYNVSFSQEDYNNDPSANKVLVDPTTGKLTFNQTIAANSTISIDYSYGSISSDVAVSGETTSVSADGTVFYLSHGNINTSQPATIKVDGTDYTVYFDQTAFDNDPGTTKVLVDPTTGKMTFGQTITAGSVITSDYTFEGIAFTITTPDDKGNMVNHDFQFDLTASLNDILNAINKSDAGVSAFYDDATGKVAISRSKTGDYNKSGYEMLFSGSFLTDTLKLDAANEQGGQDATITINGLATTRHDNTFTVNGVTFTLKQNFTSPVTVSVSNDTDGIYDKIKAWVDKYNDTIDKINAKLSEKRYRDYPPLTDEQKKDMSEDEINLWNQKAMSGMLADDTILRDGLAQMRLELYKQVSGVSNTKYDQLAEIGITTSSDYTQNGKLEIDETKLKQALADDPQAVIDLFTKTGSTDDDTGIMKRLQKTIQDTMNKVKQKAGDEWSTYDQYFIGKDMHDLDERISAFEDHLNDVQNRYYAQFTAMEEAIQMANQQSSYIMSFLNPGQ
jgi:flagellar hook-associated protein 2